jgi:hypothetical protein
MRLQLTMLAAAALAAGPAAAQGYGTFSPGGHKPPSYGGYHPALPAAPAAPKPRATPRPTEPKPYKPPSYTSVYSAPKSAPRGAKDCELSVFVNACGKKR